ncbi:unnamed protein product [Rotaria sordida]|uniref:Uncharacterized protein n=1 Tax=Rotaria sordida TaxID=392033 RepID=A0A818XQN4_9BILA|nr:unnamed protein product [Rotaria sordida]
MSNRNGPQPSRLVDFDENNRITKKEFIRCHKNDRSLYELLVVSCVPKPNCSDDDLSGQEKCKILITADTQDETFNIKTYFPVHRWVHVDEYHKMTKIGLILNQPPGYAQ